MAQTKSEKKIERTRERGNQKKRGGRIALLLVLLANALTESHMHRHATLLLLTNALS